MKPTNFDAKLYTIVVRRATEQWSAVCPELMVSGLGSTKKEAIKACVISMRSSLALNVKLLSEVHTELGVKGRVRDLLNIIHV